MRTIAAILTVLTATPVLAAPPSQWMSVDQAVADLDPLAVSFRRLGAGLRVGGEHTNVYQAVGPNYDRPQWANTAVGVQLAVYYYIAPGYIARVNRLEYLVRVGEKETATNIAPRKDGEFIEQVPANTVFEIRSPSQIIAEATRVTPVASPPPAMIQGMPSSSFPIDGRVNGQIDGRIEGRVRSEPSVGVPRP